ERLQPVARSLDSADVTVCVGEHVRLEIGQRWRIGARAHIRPYDATTLSARVRSRAHPGPKIRFGGLIWHINALALKVELPAVVDAAQTRLFAATEEE